MAYLAHKIEIKASKQAIAYFRQCAGAARFAYNKSLFDWKSEYDSGGKPSGYSLQKLFTKFKKENKWCLQIPAAVFDNAILNAEKAYKAFFKKINGYPKFKSKHKTKPSFNPWNGGRLLISGNTIHLPKFGLVRLSEKLRFDGRIVQGVISEKAGKWFLTISVEVKKHEKKRTGCSSIGLDLGCKSLVTDSNGVTHKGAKPLQKLLARLQKLSKSLARKVKGSANRAKAKLKLARLHARISNIRLDSLHKLTTDYVLKNSKIAIENLDVLGILKNKRVARSVADQSFGEFRRQLEYKSKLYGSTLYVVDRWFPSTKTCSGCGQIKNMTLKDRVYKCESCGLLLGRDHNAALNLLEQIPLLERKLTPIESISLVEVGSDKFNDLLQKSRMKAVTS